MGNIRDPLTFLSGMTGGTPNIRVPLDFLSVLTTGQAPHLRAPLVMLEPLTGGQPNIRVPLIILQALIPIPEPLPVATLVFPTLRGLTFDTKKAPEFNTGARKSTSGREVTNAYQTYPIWNFEFSYDYLPDSNTGASGYSDLRTLVGFFLQCQGKYQAFLFHDVDDYHVVGGAIATADGVTLQWPFFRNFGGFAEPVGQLDLSTLATFPASAVNTGTNAINIPNHGLTTGQEPPVFVSSTGMLPTGLTANTPYWVIVVDANHIQLATTLPRAQAALPITLSATGSGTDTITKGWIAYQTAPENHTVPASGPFTVTVTNASQFASDGGVTVGGVAMAKITQGSPAAGQYIVDPTTGIYTFNAAQASGAAVITYTWQATTASLTLPNQLVFSSAPPSGQLITADFDFYYVCRFSEDKNEFNQFLSKLWDLQKLDFHSILQ